MEIETETSMEIDFSSWSKEKKADLIWIIQKGGRWEFEGEVCIDYDPDPMYDEGRE